MKRGGQVWIRIFPHLAKTKKPLEVRMGSGKGCLLYTSGQRKRSHELKPQ